MYHSRNMGSSFIDLPPVALSAIFALLHEEDYPAFIALQSTCRKHRRFSESLLLRCIVLTGKLDCERVLLKRMWSVEEGIAKHVHCIRIVPFESRPKVAEDIAAMLEPCWSLLINLRDRIWECPLPMPRYLLNLISTRPTLRLHYINTERDHHVMDRSLLSHPNLHTLKFTAFTMGSPSHAWLSEMTQLKTCLMQACNLKVLHLHLHDSQNCSMSDFQIGELNLQFAAGDNLPALHELVLDPVWHSYQLTPEHCGAWMNCMSWCQLHTLDFGDGSPTHLMSALTGHVPQLKNLTFGFCFDPEAAPMWRCDDLTIVENFVLAIDALRSVKILSHTDDQMRRIRTSMFEKHGQGLRTVCAELGVRDAWELEDFVQLAEKAPNVQSLTTTLRVVRTEDGKESRWPGDGAAREGTNCSHVQTSSTSLGHSLIATPRNLQPRSSRFGNLKSVLTSSTSRRTRVEKPASIMSKPSNTTAATSTTIVQTKNIHEALTFMHSLRNLKLNVLLCHDTYDLIVDTRYPIHPVPSILDRAKAAKLVLRLWNDFGSGSRIERIQVVFHAPGLSGKMWAYTVGRKWRAGKFGVEVDVVEEGWDVEVFDPCA